MGRLWRQQKENCRVDVIQIKVEQSYIWEGGGETEVASLKTKIAELEADRDQHRYKASHADRHEIMGSYGRILDPLREQWMNKKKEVAAEI